MTNYEPQVVTIKQFFSSVMYVVLLISALVQIEHKPLNSTNCLVLSIT